VIKKIGGLIKILSSDKMGPEALDPVVAKAVSRICKKNPVRIL